MTKLLERVRRDKLSLEFKFVLTVKFESTHEWLLNSLSNENNKKYENSLLFYQNMNGFLQFSDLLRGTFKIIKNIKKYYASEWITNEQMLRIKYAELFT